MRVMWMLALAAVVGCGSDADDGTAAWKETDDGLTYVDPPEPNKLARHKGAPGMDLLKISIQSDGEDVTVVFTFKEDIETTITNYERLDYSQAIPTHVYIDLDNDAGTGGIASSKRKTNGFELEIKVALIAETDWSSGEQVILGAIAFYATRRFKDGEDTFAMYKRVSLEEDLEERSARTEATRDLCEIEGNQLTVHFPYVDLDVNPGETIRMAIQECDVKTFADGFYLPDATVKLK